MSELIFAPVGGHTGAMARRVTSAAFLGRETELAAMRAATKAAAAGESRIVLVSGDAGIGKTRLVQAACAQAALDRYGTAVGGCLQLGEVPLAYAPVVELLRGLREELGEETFAQLAPPALTALLGGEQTGSGQLFTPLLDFLIRLGGIRPWLIVFEDLHWADASTRDLLAFLGRNLRRAAITLVLTYRSDELHRRHPLRPLLGDLERVRDTERIPLTGLSRHDLVDLLIGLGRGDVDLAGVSALLARTGGNPLYAEELVAAAPSAASLHAGLPATLSEVVLTRVGQLSTTTQSVLRKAAVLSTDLDERLLAACCGLPPDEITEALREAVSAQLVVLDGGRCRFRHALLAEALYEDLLPGERQLVHVAAARALESGTHTPGLPEHVRWTLLAYHWGAAHDLPAAFAASLRAGREGVRVNAHSAAAGHLERALELWDRVPDAAATAGMDRAALLLQTAEAVHFSSASPRQLALVNAAYEALDSTTEPEHRAMVLERVAHMHWELHREVEAAAAFTGAAGLLADRPPSPERASALAALGQSLMLREHPEAEATLREAIACAEPIAAHRAEAHARASLGVVEAELGRVDEGVASMRRALDQSRAHGTPGQVARCHANLVATLLRAGGYDDVVGASVEALEYCAGAGQLEQYGEAINALRIVALTYLGRWSEAIRVDAELGTRLAHATTYANYLASRRLLRQLWAGEYEAAALEVDRLLEATADASTSHLRAVTLFRSGELAWGQRRWDHARAAFEAGLRVYDGGVGQFYVAHGLASALATEADRVHATSGAGPRVAAEVAGILAVADGLAQRVAALRARVGQSLTRLLPETAAWLAVADAEHARVRRADTAGRWHAVAVGWDRLGVLYPGGVARWRAAEAALRDGDGRKVATGYAAEALEIAERIGAARLADEVRLLEQRARLDLESARAPEPQPRLDALSAMGVTRREAEVLDLLAGGRTNRQIAEALFISEKTASVHVTNLLRKLGVSSRIEAAAIAQRLGGPGD